MSYNGKRKHGAAYSNKKKSASKKKRKKVSGKPIVLFILLIIAAVVIVIALAGYKFAYEVFDDVAIDESDMTKYEITLKEGEDDKWQEQIYDFLTENDFIDSLNIYKWREKLYSAEYTAGTYILRRSYTTEKIINILSGYVYSTSGTLEED